MDSSSFGEFSRRAMILAGGSALLASALSPAVAQRGRARAAGKIRVDALCYDPSFSPEAVEKVIAAGLGAVVFDINTSREYEPAIREMGAWQRRFADPEFKVVPVLIAADFARARSARKLGIVLACQDASIVGSSLADWRNKLQLFHALGLRLLQVTHNARTHWGDSYMEKRDGGLSLAGAQLIAAMNEQRMIIDLAHCSRQTLLDAVTASKRPCAVTHAGCKALAPTARNKTDEEIRAIGRSGGFFGIYNMTTWLTTAPTASLDTVISHIDHAVQLIGPERVGFGSDGAVETLDAPAEVARMARVQQFNAGGPSAEWPVRHVRVPELNAANRMEALAEGLIRKGYSEAQADGIAGGNFVRFFGEVCG